MKKTEPEDQPVLAEGIDTEEELEQPATKEEVAEGDFTKVIELVYDETDPS